MESKKMNEMSFKEYEAYWANKSLSNNKKIMQNLRVLLRIAGKILKIVFIVSIAVAVVLVLANAIKNGQMTQQQVWGLIITAGFLWAFFRAVRYS
ncbi:MAG: hypothetical protein M1300_04555 [Epsilonproteobacteria bacterium]|nr:hypothetical protein [Campylobacterota bacterium]